MCDGMPLTTGPVTQFRTESNQRPGVKIMKYLVCATNSMRVGSYDTLTNVVWSKVCSTIIDIKEIERAARSKGLETTVFGWDEKRGETFDLSPEQFMEIN